MTRQKLLLPFDHQRFASTFVCSGNGSLHLASSSLRAGSQILLDLSAVERSNFVVAIPRVQADSSSEVEAASHLTIFIHSNNRACALRIDCSPVCALHRLCQIEHGKPWYFHGIFMIILPWKHMFSMESM